MVKENDTLPEIANVILFVPEMFISAEINISPNLWVRAELAPEINFQRAVK